MNRAIDFQNNELIDRDVQYGFGKEQLQPWFDSFMEGKSTIDTFQRLIESFNKTHSSGK